MLRITLHDEPSSLTFELEGKLGGPWVKELEDCWRRYSRTNDQDDLHRSPPKPVVRFDLRGVTYIDAAGKKFLAARYSDGAEFLASGCLMPAVIAEIKGDPIPDCVAE
jgi:hypothetical protein